MNPRKATPIQRNLFLAGFTQEDVARRANVNPMLVSRVVRGLSKHRKVRETIAEMLCVDFDSLWATVDEPPDKSHAHCSCVTE